MKRMEQHGPHPRRQRGRWLILCLLSMSVLFASLGQSAPAQANITAFQYVATAADAGLDCDHALAGGHCCGVTACTGYAQIESPFAAPAEMSSGHPPAITPGIRVGRMPRPSLQPPKRSSQA
jgi:hypothetical protein